jgi:hypothetical protein
LNRYSDELTLPGTCSVVLSRTFVLSYQPLEARLAFSKVSSKSSVPAGGGGGGGGAFTVTAEVPLFPDEVAVIVADPPATPVTTPLELTVAMPVLLDVHAIVCPVMVFPSASLTTAVSETVAPTAIEADGGETVTVVTTGGGGGAVVTVMLELPDFPDALAEIVADPPATPVTTPPELTVAVAALSVDHATT